MLVSLLFSHFHNTNDLATYDHPRLFFSVLLTISLVRVYRNLKVFNQNRIKYFTPLLDGIKVDVVKGD
jgi:hypothetical protein